MSSPLFSQSVPFIKEEVVSDGCCNFVFPIFFLLYAWLTQKSIRLSTRQREIVCRLTQFVFDFVLVHSPFFRSRSLAPIVGFETFFPATFFPSRCLLRFRFTLSFRLSAFCTFVFSSSSGFHMCWTCFAYWKLTQHIQIENNECKKSLWTNECIRDGPRCCWRHTHTYANTIAYIYLSSWHSTRRNGSVPLNIHFCDLEH